MKPLFAGNFSTPSGDRVEARWHRDGLEEYFVNGERVLLERTRSTSFTRRFLAGIHEVRIEFSLFRFTCKAYVDNELVAPEVFPGFGGFHDWQQSYWPSTNSWIGALKASSQGFWAALSIAILSIVLSVYSIRVAPLFENTTALIILLQGLVFVALAFGIRKQSRLAAILALMWYSIAQIVEATAAKSLPSLLALFFIFFLVNGVRGVFAVHRFPEPADIAPDKRVRNYQD